MNNDVGNEYDVFMKWLKLKHPEMFGLHAVSNAWPVDIECVTVTKGLLSNFVFHTLAGITNEYYRQTT